LIEIRATVAEILRSETIGSNIRFVIEIPIFGYFGVWSLRYIATPVAKADIIFLLGDPEFLQRQRNFAPISLTFRDLTRDRQTDRRQTRRPLQKALTFTKCAESVISIEQVALKLW